MTRDFTNRLLKDLPPSELAVFGDSLERVPLAPGEIIQRERQPIESVYFIESGMVSRVGVVDEDDLFEVYGVGYAGKVGTGAQRADGTAALQGLVQIEGEAWRI